MGKVYAPPKELGDVPQLNSRTEPWQTYQERVNQYVDKVQQWAKQNGQGDLAGKRVSFQFADGYAQYVVFKTKPVVLIHLPVGDAWQYPYVNRLTTADIREKVRRAEGLSKLFASKG